MKPADERLARAEQDQGVSSRRPAGGRSSRRSLIPVLRLAGIAFLIAGCATGRPRDEQTRATLLGAAHECQRKFPTIQVGTFDHSGRLSYTSRPPGTEIEAFLACYRAKVREAGVVIPEVGRVVLRPGASMAISVPIEMAGSHFRVAARVNDVETARLLIDTGAGTTIITPGLAARAGLSVPATATRWPITVAGGTRILVPSVRLASLSVGDARVEDIDVGVYDITPGPSGIDGILGQSFLGHFTVTLDPDAQRLGLVAKVAAPASAPLTGAATQRSWDVPDWKVGDEWSYRWETPGGKGTGVMVVKAEETIDDTAYWVIARGGTLAYYAKRNLGWHMDTWGKDVVSRAVPDSGHQWPLRVGSTWERRYRYELPAQRQTAEILYRCGVTALEEITVPAGTFEALHIVCRDPTGRDASEEWYAPAAKMWAKTRTFLREGIRVWELTSYRVH